MNSLTLWGILPAVVGAIAVAACHEDPVLGCNGNCSSDGGSSESGDVAGASETAAGGNAAAAGASEAEGGAGAALATGAAGSQGSAGAAGIASDGGDGGQMPSAAGATSTAPGCITNVDCNDGLACNGSELCAQGKCVAGDSFACAAPARCAEQAQAAACVFPEGERFIVYEVDDLNPWWNLAGTSISDLAHPTQVNLSQGANDTEYNWLDGFYFSPDGRRLVFPVVHLDQSSGDVTQKFFWFDFTQPLASQPRRVQDVPINADFSAGGWSPSSNAVLIGRNDFGRVDAYAVRFSSSTVQTVRVPTDGQVELCRDDASVAYEANGATHVAALWSSPTTETVLAAGLRGRSPDGKWLLLSDKKHAYLARCQAQTQLVPLAQPAAITGNWSSDSQYVAYAQQDWDIPETREEAEEVSSKALSVFRVQEGSAPTAVLQLSAASPEVNFEPGGTRFTYLAIGARGAHVRHLRDAADRTLDQVIALQDERGRSIVPPIDWLGATGRLVYQAALDSQSDESPAAAYSLKTAPQAKPRRLVSGFTWLAYADDRSKAVWIETQSGNQGDHSQVYTLDLEDEQSLPLALFPEPVSGSLRFARDNPQARVIYRDVDFPENNLEIFVLPQDLKSTPVSVKRGSVLEVDDALSLQPRP